MNDIPSPRVLLIAAKRPKQFDDHILPKMRDFGITVVRTVEPTFRGSLEDIDAVFVMFEFCGRETYAALRRQCEIAKVKFTVAFAAAPRGRWVSANRAAMTSRVTTTPLAPVPVPPVLALPVKTNGHSHHRPPLEALLRAARAVGITGDVTVTVTEQGTTVHVGAEVFSGAFDDAVEKARGVLVERLREQQRRAGELLAELAGAA